MNKIFLLVVFTITTINISAQVDPVKDDLDRFNRPTVSPRAEVSQKIGLDFIKINYGRPNVRGRKIFGGLLEYNKIWRVGADHQTTIDFQNEYIINGNIIKKGKYAICALPFKDKWTIYFTKDIDGWGYYTYNPDDNLYQFDVPVQKTAEFTETFTIGFTNTALNKGELFIKWENSRVKLDITVSKNHRKQIARNFDVALGLDKVILRYRYYLTGEYYFLEEKNNKKALEYVEKSINLGNTSFPAYFLKGEILYALGKKQEAIEAVLNSKKVLPEFLNPEWDIKIKEAVEKWSKE